MVNLGCFITIFAVLGHHLPSAHGTSQKFAFFIDKDVVYNHALEGHVFKTSTFGRATQCHMLCKDDCRCISMNFIQDTDQDNCELNDVNKEMKPAALKYKPGVNYYDLVREYTTDQGRSFVLKHDRCINRCCQTNPCLNGGTCEEICDPTTVRFNCSCPGDYTGQRCEKLKYPRSCKDLVTNGVEISGMSNVYDFQNNPFQVYCDFDSEVDFVWTLVQSFSLRNVNQFNTKRFVDDYPVNEDIDDATTIWESYRLSLSRMQSVVGVSTHLRATCNFPDDDLLYTDYARAQLKGHDLFGTWSGECRVYELVSIRRTECRDCTAATWQRAGYTWHINSYLSASVGCDFNGTVGSVSSEQNFGRYRYTNPAHRCTSNVHSTTQYWIGSKLSN